MHQPLGRRRLLLINDDLGPHLEIMSSRKVRNYTSCMNLPHHRYMLQSQRRAMYRRRVLNMVSMGLNSPGEEKSNLHQRCECGLPRHRYLH